MVVSLLGYFFSMVTVFTAAMALLISFDDSRMITHNPHPVIVVPAIVTISSDDRHLPGSVQGQSARYASAKDAQSSRTIAGAKTDTKRFRNSAVAKAELIADYLVPGDTQILRHSQGQSSSGALHGSRAWYRNVPASSTHRRAFSARFS